jgi:5S rRNA maturation endonuclease (ribonuclease M5)
MTRENIIASNPLPDYLRGRGFSLFPAGPNFVTNVCPVEEHRKFHRCVTIDTAKNVFHCNDHKVGGSLIDWVALEENITAAEAMRKLDGGRNGASTPEWKISRTYDYTDASGNLLYQVCRLVPKDFRQRRPDGSGGWVWNMQGVERVLYHLPEVLKTNTVCVTEGEKDADNLCKLGFTATCNSGGAKKWRDEYSEVLRGKDVLIFGDDDEEGRKHVEQVTGSLQGKAKSITETKFGAHDISDYIKSFPSLDEAKAAVTKLIAEAQQPKAAPIAEQPRVAKVEPPLTPTTIVEWRKVMTENFPTLARCAEICASVEAQLLLNDVVNPFALGLVDVPSAGKTILLNIFNVSPLSYATDHFSPAAFVSHATNKKREELPTVDLLPRIRFKAMIVRDLAPIFGAKEEELKKTLAVVTRALDGEGLQTDSGVHGQRGYVGDYLFMMLCGTTPPPPKVFKTMATLGGRMFFLALHSEKKSRKTLIAQNRGRHWKTKEKACHEATTNFLRTLWSENPSGIDWDTERDPFDCMDVIARCAELLASLRGTIETWESDYDGSVTHNAPIKEHPDRINCLFYNLARGHALICGRRQISRDDLWPIIELTFDSASPIRSRVFRHLLKKSGTLNTTDVEKLLDCSPPTARKEMDALSALGVADKSEFSGVTTITLTSEFQWFTSDECSSLMQRRLGYMPEDQLIKEVKGVFPNAAVIA